MGEVTMNLVGAVGAQGSVAAISGASGRSGNVQPPSAASSEAARRPAAGDGDPDHSGKEATVAKAAEMINRALAEGQRELRFSVDEASGRTLVFVMHPETGEVVRQIPSEVVLAMAEMLESGEPLRSLGIEYQG